MLFRSRGIVEYDPGELTLTARPGTTIAELCAELAPHAQHLPFDPPLAAAGATLGGTVASGLSGPGAFGHGSVRDFVIGVQIVDGTGALVRGGGKVVKNAAGFDLPKLMVGSIGRLGVMTEISLKVFPEPATATYVFELDDMAGALGAIARVARGGLDVQALEIEPPGRLVVRVAGGPSGATERSSRLEMLVGTSGVPVADPAQVWRRLTELEWVPEDHVVVRAAVTPRLVPAVDALAAGAPRHYANAANVAWIAWPADRDLDELERGLVALGVAAMRLTRPPGPPLMGARPGGAFAARVKRAIDPDGRFLEL